MQDIDLEKEAKLVNVQESHYLYSRVSTSSLVTNFLFRQSLIQFKDELGMGKRNAVQMRGGLL